MSELDRDLFKLQLEYSTLVGSTGRAATLLREVTEKAAAIGAAQREQKMRTAIADMIEAVFARYDIAHAVRNFNPEVFATTAKEPNHGR